MIRTLHLKRLKCVLLEILIANISRSTDVEKYTRLSIS